MSLPATKNNRANNKRRNVVDMESTTASHVIGATGIRTEEPLIFCGKHNKAIPIIRQLVKQSSRPFVLLGTRRDLAEDSCLRVLDVQWESEHFSYSLPDGNGILVLGSDAQTYLDLKECVSKWDSHLIIFCVGNGLQVDQELLNLLNGVGHYILLSESLQRSIKSTEGNKMTASDLLTSMEYILVSSIGTAGKDLLNVLPTFEYEKITNTMDLTIHQAPEYKYRGGRHHGGGLVFGQSKTQESRSIFTQEDLRHMQDANMLIIHNASASHTWVARISG